MAGNYVRELVASERNLPGIAEEISSRQPKLFFLKQPKEPRETHVAPNSFIHAKSRAICHAASIRAS